jgi:hypothetical protein
MIMTESVLNSADFEIGFKKSGLKTGFSHKISIKSCFRSKYGGVNE